jgi:hypothetical protein
MLRHDYASDESREGCCRRRERAGCRKKQGGFCAGEQVHVQGRARLPTIGILFYTPRREKIGKEARRSGVEQIKVRENWCNERQRVMCIGVTKASCECKQEVQCMR